MTCERNGRLGTVHSRRSSESWPTCTTLSVSRPGRVRLRGWPRPGAIAQADRFELRLRSRLLPPSRLGLDGSWASFIGLGLRLGVLWVSGGYSPDTSRVAIKRGWIKLGASSSGGLLCVRNSTVSFLELKLGRKPSESTTRYLQAST